MGKSHRGKGIRNLPNQGRGTCPVCKRTGVKLLYDLTPADGSGTVKVCKQCSKRRVQSLTA